MNIYAAVPLLSSLAYALLLALTLRHPRRAERSAFGLFLASAGAWSLTSFALHLDYAFFRDLALPGSRLLILAIVWMVVTYYHFVRVFVQRPAWPGVRLGVVYVLVVVVVFALGLAPRGARAEGGIIYIDHGPWLLLYYAPGISLGIIAGYSLVRHYREVTTAVARTRVAYLLIGLGVLSVAILTNVSETLSIYPIDQVGNLINAAIISYAILKYNLLEISLVLRRGLAYTAISFVLTATYLLSLYLIYNFSRFSLQATLVPATALALIMALVFIPLRDFTQERVDRLFYRHTYAYRKVLLDFSKQAASILALDELSQEMVRVIINALRARWGMLLVPDPITSQFRPEHAQRLAGDNSPLDLRLRQDNPLLSYMAQEGKALRRDAMEVMPQAKGLWLEERQALRTLQVSLLCPVLIREKLTSVIALGPKETGDDYTEEEAQLLLAMASGAAVAMENAQTLATLRNREKAHEQLLSHVVSAQEEERQRVAADLHDGVAQWLVRASYQTQVATALSPKSQANGLQQELTDIESTIDASVKELRRVLAGLRPPALEELGLPHALEKELESMRAAGIAGSMELVGNQVRLPPPVEIATYRLVQEALNNVRRHSKARNVSVRLQFQADRVRIQVSDDGVGFDVARVLSGGGAVGHLGILGMRQRAESLGGELQVHSREGGGTQIVFEVPFNTAVKG